MTNLQKKVVTAIATGTLLFSSVVPVFADTSITIDGNGSSTNNSANVTTTHSITVVQTNTANVNNTVNSQASTGENSASGNTGGNTVIETGDAVNRTKVDTSVNLNKAEVAGNCNCNPSQDVTIKDNGSFSDNNVKLKTSNDANVFQTNAADISNNVNAKAQTGENNANRNTGGDVAVLTGRASSGVEVNNAANANQASLGGGNGAPNGTITLKEAGNGFASYNDIYFDHKHSALITQDNSAYISNVIKAAAYTGDNSASDNTNGNVTIETGKAESAAVVNNLANFNSANDDCGCMANVDAKAADNGAFSDNNIKAKLTDAASLFQTNAFSVDNPLSAKAKSGDNTGDNNTGSMMGIDPVLVLSGDASNGTQVDNTANVNLVGPMSSDVLPGGLDFSFDFNINGILSALSL